MAVRMGNVKSSALLYNTPVLRSSYIQRHKFEWKREACYMLRKPDPPVLVAVAEPEKKNKNGVVQILDYNLNRYACFTFVFFRAYPILY
jgi:hypothetical protein